MAWLIVLSIVSLMFAAIPAMMFFCNLRFYLPPRNSQENDCPQISVLIPARNEEHAIRSSVEAALASTSVKTEVIVLDDHSTDNTAAIVKELAIGDDRLHLVNAPSLPDGWSGKQHACQVLSTHARFELLAFLDADVKLSPTGLARMSAFLKESEADLVSGIPRQKTETIWEKCVIPLIHFVLLGFLPIRKMRQNTDPAFGAGCGQLFLVRRSAYESAGGHTTIRTSFHDGLKLPRAFRNAGFRTDLCDATDVAECRMYRSGGALWHGLAKNAREGLASPGMIVPATVLLIGGQVMPYILLGLVWNQWLVVPALLGICAASLPRLFGVVRFRQSILGALLHPIGIVLLLAIQWYAVIRAVIGKPIAWKGRTQTEIVNSFDTPVP